MESPLLYRIILIIFGAAAGCTALFAGGRDIWILSIAGMLLGINCILILYRIRKKGEKIPIPPMSIILAVFFLYMGAVSFYRDTWTISYPFLIKLAVYTLAYVSAFLFFNKSPKISLFFITLTIIGALFTLYGLIRFLYDVYHEAVQSPALKGPYVNKNHFAGFMEMVIPCGAALLFFQFQKSQKALILYAVILMGAGLGFSMSRGGWISFLIGCIIYAILLFPLSRKKGAVASAGIAAGIVILCIAAFYFIGITPIIQKVESTVDDEYLGMEGRYHIWESSFQSIKENPWLGKGAGTYPYLFQKYRPRGIFKRVMFAHSDYIQILFETGIVGLLFIIIMLGERIYPYILSGYKFHSDKILSRRFNDVFTPKHCWTRFAAALSITAAVTAVAVHSFVDFSLHLSTNGILFAVLLGIGMRIGYDLPQDNDEKKAAGQTKDPDKAEEENK